MHPGTLPSWFTNRHERVCPNTIALPTFTGKKECTPALLSPRLLTDKKECSYSHNIAIPHLLNTGKKECIPLHSSLQNPRLRIGKKESVYPITVILKEKSQPLSLQINRKERVSHYCFPITQIKCIPLHSSLATNGQARVYTFSSRITRPLSFLYPTPS